MPKLTPKNPKNKATENLRHPMEFDDFVQWIATPEALRTPKTQAELAKKFGVGADTLSEWKQRNGFWEAVAQVRKSWGQERTPDVILGLYKRAQTGSAAEVKLWLQYFEGWTEKNLVKVEDDTYNELRSLTDEELMQKLKEAKAALKK